MSGEQSVLSKLRTEDGTIDARALNTGQPRGCAHQTISPRDCYRLRAALARGATLKSHTRSAHYGSSGAYQHAAGECQHEGVGCPPLRYDRFGRGDGEWVIDR